MQGETEYKYDSTNGSIPFEVNKRKRKVDAETMGIKTISFSAFALTLVGLTIAVSLPGFLWAYDVIGLNGRELVIGNF